MSVEYIVVIVVALISASGSIVAAAVARSTQKLTKPIGNGFASDVTRRLDRIEGHILTHLEDHTQHDLMRRRRGSS